MTNFVIYHAIGKGVFAPSVLTLLRCEFLYGLKPSLRPRLNTSMPLLPVSVLAARVSYIQLVDQLLVADEFKCRNIIFGQVYGVMYLAFNVGWYYLAPREDRLIYEILDWENKPLAACIYGLGCILVLGPLFGALHFGVYRCSSKPLLSFPRLPNGDTLICNVERMPSACLCLKCAQGYSIY